ncbi:hypothetical protein FACS1894172_10800 [Spirochaetia bacterium]|nr:hypothetical protein FACS1894172_10800 [Spirochaetia bacterium]
MKIVPVILITLLCTGCDIIHTAANSSVDFLRQQFVTGYYYRTGTAQQRREFQSLFTLLDQEPGDERCAVIREIITRYLRQKDYGRLINFLNEQIKDGDPYNAYYAFSIAFAYLQLNAPQVVFLYCDMILKNYPDVFVDGQSIHFACLNELIALDSNPESQVHWYQELIARFPEKIDAGVTYFMLAKAYEKTGAWNDAIKTYTKYLDFPGTIVPDYPDSDHYAKQLVDFNKSPKDWTFENLNTLVATIKSALNAGNSTQLWQYRAKVNFFARSWAQEATDDFGMADFNLGQFMSGRISYTNQLDASSNAVEAYLRTWGWAQYSTWYLYFRKINFPADPEIHGRWEWAGLYYGEKF